jgi:hypothetical protein
VLEIPDFEGAFAGTVGPRGEPIMGTLEHDKVFRPGDVALSI